MTDSRLADMIGELSAGLTPVRRLGSPLRHAALWLGAVLVLAAILYVLLGRGLGDMTARPWVLPGFIGAVAASVGAAVAAFMISRPDRSDAWLLLPVLPVVLWVTAVIIGCIEGAGDPETWGSAAEEIRACLTVIIGASVPLSALVIVMIRRARPERWLKVAILGGLASAAAAGSILILVNPHNSTVLDVAIHTVCVAAVVSITALVGGRFLRTAR